jgi:hypothetical protein
MRLRHPERVLSGRGDVRTVPLFDESPADERGHLHLVFHDQYSHVCIVDGKMRRR